MKIQLSFLLCNRWLLTFILLASIIQTTFAVDPIKEDPKFKVIAERFQTDFGATIKLAQSKDDVVATNYDVRVLEPAQLENAIKVLTWLETEYKRFPAGFFKSMARRISYWPMLMFLKHGKGQGFPIRQLRFRKNEAIQFWLRCQVLSPRLRSSLPRVVFIIRCLLICLMI